MHLGEKSQYTSMLQKLMYIHCKNTGVFSFSFYAFTGISFPA